MTHDGRMRWRAGIDIGGTFTDFVLHDGCPIASISTSG